MKVNLTTVLGGLSALIGAWFWITENSYAAETGSQLAATLQWVGIAQVITGVAIILISKEK
jgi:predicted phage tail protein